MNERGEANRLYGWDDGKIYFWSERRKEEFCVSDEKALYAHLTDICHRYFESKLAGKTK